MIRTLDVTLGRHARNRLEEARAPGATGALAALESFYHAFNQRSLAVLRHVWLDDPGVQLNNPLGGIVRGREGIEALYERIFNGPAHVWVEFHDVVEYAAPDVAIFAGRERGEYARGETRVPLAIRTTRVFRYIGEEGGWRQVHHHGSIDDAALLDRYQRAVR